MERDGLDCNELFRQGVATAFGADATAVSAAYDAFIDAAEACGYPKNKDYNNGNQEGFGYFQVTMKNGKRQSTARWPRWTGWRTDRCAARGSHSSRT